MTDCSGCSRDKTIQLNQGSIVCTYCTRYLTECEARSLLKLPIDIRRERLNEITLKRGAPATDKLKGVMKQLWEKTKGIRK